MPFRKENDPAAPLNAAAFEDQAEPDSVDFDILASSIAGEGVISGCLVTPNAPADMTVLVATGFVRVAGVTVEVIAGSVAIAAAGASPRFDLIVVDILGVLSAVSGPTDVNPVYASIPANSIVLAAVYVPAGTTAIDADRITDKTTLLVPGVSREFWAVVDINGDGDYRLIQQAIDAQARSIFVREGPFQPGFTVLATDAVTRIVGATPGDGSVLMPGAQITTDVTIQKADILIEQLLFNNVFAPVVVRVQAPRVTFLACAWSGGLLAANTSTISVNASGSDLLLLFSQARGNPGGAGGWLSFTGVAARPKLIQCIIRDYSGVSSIIDDGGFDIREGQITACSFINNTNTVFLVDITNSLFWNLAGCTITVLGAGGGFIDCDVAQIAGCTIDAVTPNGQTLIRGVGVFTGNTLLNCDIAINLQASATSVNSIVSNNLIVNFTAPNTGISIAVDATHTVIISNNLAALKTTDVSKTAGASMTVLGNTFLSGTPITGSEAARDFIFGNSGGTGNPLDIRGTLFTPEVDDEMALGSSSSRFDSLFVTEINDQVLTRGTLALVNGANVAITLPDFAGPIIITGPTAPFSIDGILDPPGTASPDNAKQFILINNSGQTMTIVNESAAVPAFFPQRRIHTMTGANVVIAASGAAGDRGAVILIYDETGVNATARWLLIGTQG